MNKYELALVLNGRLEEDAKAAALEKVQGYITRFNGTVTGIEDLGKQRLAYEIQKQKEAYYSFILFESDNSDTPVELENRLRLREDILRFLCVRLDEA